MGSFSDRALQFGQIQFVTIQKRPVRRTGRNTGIKTYLETANVQRLTIAPS